MKTALSFLFALTLAGNLWSQSNEEFRSTWIVDSQWLLSGNSVEENKALTREVLNNHVAANMTSVLWQIRRWGAVYYPSDIEPWGRQFGGNDPGYDPVQYALEQAHARGLEFHAWFNTFESRLKLPGSPSAVHPEWVCRDQSGIAMPDDIAWLSPGLPAVRTYLINVAMEIVSNYDIDGLHLDFVRWNEHTNSGQAVQLEKDKLAAGVPEGLISAAQMEALSANQSGRFLYDTEHPFSAGVPAGFATWEDWWRATVTDFVHTLHDSVQAVKPWVRLSPAALGRYNWGGWQGFHVVYQDAALWLNEGYIEQLVGMHYHWRSSTDFLNVLSNGCPNCWSQFIQPAIADGRLYTVGFFSDDFSERGIFSRHPSLITTVRSVPWVDGVQFFSYASWRDNRYWDEAGEKAFPGKSKIRATGLVDSTPPAAPSLSLSKLDSLEYQINITPNNPSEPSYWFAIYRSQDDILNTENDQIIDIHFGGESYTFTDSISGLQDFNGAYTYFSTALDRYWNESPESNSALSDAIPSLAPIVIATSPAEGDTIPVNSDFVLQFSKTIATNSAQTTIEFAPAVEISTLSWSDNNKALTVTPSRALQFATDYSLTISPQLTDVNGRAIDGNRDGVEGDAFILAFTTLGADEAGPVVISTYPTTDDLEPVFAIDEVVTFVFDELLDENSVAPAEITFRQGTADIPFNFQIARVQDQSVLSIQTLAPLEQDQEYQVTLASTLSDTLGNEVGNETAISFRTAPERYSEVVLIDQFLSTVNWFQPNQSGSTQGIIVPNTSFTMSTDTYLPFVTSRQRISPALEYEWDETAGSFLIRVFLSTGPPRSVEFDASYILQCFVFGDGSNNKFRFAVDDNLPVAAAENHEVSQWTTVDWLGWRLVEWQLNDPGAAGTWLGDGVLAGQLRFDSFQLTHEAGDATQGRIFFDNLRLVRKTTFPVSVTGADPQLPRQYRLLQNYPNPFNPSTTIAFELPENGFTTLKIFDLLGREVGTLLEEDKNAGDHRIVFDAAALASGIYIYQLRVNGRILSKRMLFLK